MTPKYCNLKEQFSQISIPKGIYDPSSEKGNPYFGHHNSTLYKFEKGSGHHGGGGCDCSTCEYIAALREEIERIKRRVTRLERLHPGELDKIDLDLIRELLANVATIGDPYTLKDVKDTFNFILNAFGQSILDDEIRQIPAIPNEYDALAVKEKYADLIESLLENTDLDGFDTIPEQYTVRSIKTAINNLLIKLKT